jgi:hypothetical protein
MRCPRLAGKHVLDVEIGVHKLLLLSLHSPDLCFDQTEPRTKKRHRRGADSSSFCPFGVTCMLFFGLTKESFRSRVAVVAAERMLAGCRGMSPGKGRCLEPQLIPVMTATGVKGTFKQWHRQTPRGAKKKRRKLLGLSKMKL